LALVLEKAAETVSFHIFDGKQTYIFKKTLARISKFCEAFWWFGNKDTFLLSRNDFEKKILTSPNHY